MRDLLRVVVLLLRLTKEIKYSRLLVSIVILAGIISGLSNTLLIATINSALSKAGTPTGNLVWTFAGLCLALACLRFASAAFLTGLTRKSLFGLRMSICSKILTAPLRLLEQVGSHRLLATLTDDVPSIVAAFVNLPLLFMNLAILLGCLLYLCWLSPILLLVALGFMVIGIISHQLPVLKAMQYFERSREAMDGVYKHFRGLTEGIKELKLHRRRREAFHSQLLEPGMHAMQKNAAIGQTIWSAAGSWGQILFFIFIGLILFAVPSLKPVNAAVLTGYILTVLYMMAPLEFVLNTLQSFSRANVAIKKIDALSHSLDEQMVVETAAHLEQQSSWKRLELVNLKHTYRRENEEADFSLGPIDLSLQPGELVFVTGGNGSGKTTLAKLLVGLYVPQTGEIRLDGQPITDERRDDYRQLFSVVFSDFYLFENLLGMNGSNIDVKAQEYLVKLQLDRCVQVKEKTLSTVELSQGQRKRLALLTAYLEDRPVYVFDEWAADQDPQFKEIFYHQLLPNLKAAGKTTIVISHDDRYYHIADRVVKLNYGRLEFDKQVDSLVPTPLYESTVAI